MAKIRKILVVDNNATIVELVSSHLMNAGYEVAKAFDGLQALDRLVESDQLPDVILLDLIMPRLDGQRLTRFLKQDPLYSVIPIIILTGIASEDEGTILSFGADAYIAKGRIENTMAHVFDTFRWLEARTGPEEKRTVVLGVEKLYPREMTRELLHIKGHLDTMLSLMGEGVVEIDQDHRILYANPAACRLFGSDDHRLFGKAFPGFFGDPKRIEAYLASVPCGTETSPPAAAVRARAPDAAHLLLDARGASNYCGVDRYPQGRHRPGAPGALPARAHGGDRPERPGRALPPRRRRDDPGLEPGLQPHPAPARGPHRHRHPARRLPRGHGPRDRVAAAPGGGAPDDEPRSVEFTTLVFPERVVLTTSTTIIATAEGSRVLLLIEDVTEKAAMERDLRRVNEELAKANRAKSTFLSMVSHELRTPLSVVRGYLSLILEGKIGPDPERILEALRVADKRARHLQHLIEELLDLSRIESGRLSLHKEPIAVGKHVREVVEMFRDDQDRRKLSIEIEIPEALPDALADHDKVHQIFTNFLSNAVKFTGEGGRIVVRGRVAGSMLEFVVADSGIGIPADKISRVFDKFYQVDSSDKRMYPGTGLGLAIVKMIVTALGGTVRVESHVGEGSTFTFTLPLAEAGVEAARRGNRPGSGGAPCGERCRRGAAAHPRARHRRRSRHPGDDPAAAARYALRGRRGLRRLRRPARVLLPLPRHRPGRRAPAADERAGTLPGHQVQPGARFDPGGHPLGGRAGGGDPQRLPGRRGRLPRQALPLRRTSSTP